MPDIGCNFEPCSALFRAADDGKLQIYNKDNKEATLNINVYMKNSGNETTDMCGIKVLGKKYGPDYRGLLDIKSLFHR